MKKSIFFVLSLCVLSSVAFGMNNNKSVEERSFSSFLARTDSTQSGIEGDFAEIEVGGFTKDHFRNMVGVDILEKDPKKASEIAKLGFDVFSNNMKKNSNNTADAIAAAQAKMLVAQKEFFEKQTEFLQKEDERREHGGELDDARWEADQAATQLSIKRNKKNYRLSVCNTLIGAGTLVLATVNTGLLLYTAATV